MNIDDKIAMKIAIFLQSQKGTKNAKFSETKITTHQNKEGSNLLYIRASTEKELGINHSNNSTYYAFDMNGNYVGCVKTSISNIIPPTQIEMEYWANEEYKNKGNMTVLAKDVIKEIFEDKVFDNLTVRDGAPTSNIESIILVINQDNFASLAVAKKLGFDESGTLYRDDYLKQIHGNESMGI